MARMSAQKVPTAQHAALVSEIDAHNYRYYVLDDPSVTDAAFDALMKKLRALEEEHPELRTAHSPTQRVGGTARTTVAKVKHEVRMFSLDNAYSKEDMNEFFDRVRTGLPDAETPEFVVEPKLDGASLEVIYENGRLISASTRGDGETGEDITENVRTIRGVPSAIRHAGRITLRGEILIYRKDLVKLNVEREEEGLEPFSNPRNAAAGAVRMNDPKEVAARPLRALFYQLVEGDKMHASHAESLTFMAEQGLPTHRKEELANEDGVFALIEKVDAARPHYPYETDGAVVKVSSYKQEGMLGFTSKFPKWAIAYKFAPERTSTKVLSIEINVGRTGALTPVCVCDPVELSGTTVSRASLHNEDQIERLGIRVGDRVFIEKAGEIIPQVVSVDLTARDPKSVPYEMPEACPVCNTKAVRGLKDEASPELGEEATRKCPNKNCPAQVDARIHHYSRRFSMDVDHLGIAIIEQLTRAGLVSSVPDLYTLTVDAVKKLERHGEKSAKNLVSSIAASKERTLDRLLCGLGIPQVGQVAAKQLAEDLISLPQIRALSPEALRERVAGIHGFGPKMVDSVVEFFADPDEIALMDRLIALDVGRPQPVAKVATEGPLVGKSFCVTGVLTEKRETVHERLRAAGAEIHDSVKKNTCYLVAGEKTGKTKLDQAKKFGAIVIDEARLNALIAGEA